MSIRGRLTASHFLLTLVVILIVGLVTLAGVRRLILASASRTLTSQAEQVAQVIDRRWNGQNQDKALTRLVSQLTAADFAVLDPSGRILLGSERLGRFYGASFRTTVIDQALGQGQASSATLRDLLGRLSVVAAAPVTGAPGEVGAVVLVRPVVEVTQATRRYVTLTVEALLAGLALSLVVSLFLARGLTRPLLALEAAATKVAAGDFGQRVPAGAADEFGRVARSFNAMAARLGTLQRERQELYASVSHELRTPVTSIKGFAQALVDNAGSPEDKSRHAAIILEEASRLERLVADLFQLARLEAGQVGFIWQPVDLATLVAGAAEKYRPQASAGDVRLDYDGPTSTGRAEGAGAPLVARGDPDRLNQVLANLLENALRFTPAGGRIVVRLARTSSQPVGGARTSALISVADTGPGIPDADLGKVFDRFYTVDRSRARKTGGTGLGLAIVREIVEGHGGRVWAARAPEGGALLSLVLPLGPDRRQTGGGKVE